MDFWKQLLLIGLILSFSCTDEIPDVEMPMELPTVEVDDIIPLGTENYLQYDSDYIFDHDSLFTYELIIPEENYAYINADPSAEEYVEGQLVFKGDTISPVGIRYKGSVGAYVNCLSGDDWGNPSGFKTCRKLSMKIKMNWEDREERFYKLNKLQFHSMNNDASQMRDRLGYHLFRSMGVPSPRAVHARLIINGEFNGLFSLVEQVDGRFAKYNFEDDDGNIYKEIWPLSSEDAPFDTPDYVAALKTNEDNDPDVGLIKGFAEEIASANGESEIRTILASYLDLTEILAYAVVDRTIRHDDGPFHWYCGSNNVCASHNFYWYEEPNEQKLHLIPWDLDNAFENIITDSNPVTPIADGWGEISNNCMEFNYAAFGLFQKSAACDLITGGLVSYENEYEDLLAQFKATSLSESNINDLLEKWSDQIYESSSEANQLDNQIVSILNWQLAIQQLKTQMEFARNN